MDFDTDGNLIINYDDVDNAIVDDLHIELLYMYCETDGTEGLT